MKDQKTGYKGLQTEFTVILVLNKEFVQVPASSVKADGEVGSVVLKNFGAEKGKRYWPEI